MSESVVSLINQLLETFNNLSIKKQTKKKAKHHKLVKILINGYIHAVAKYEPSQIKHLKVLSEILLNATIHIDKQLNVTNKGGILCIKSANKVIITDTGVINANGVGRYVDSEFFSRDGGIIELSAHTIINNGQISCDGRWGGSGGIIKIRCHTFINKGVIKAKAGIAWRFGDDPGIYGTIQIQCAEYKNESTIYPLPDIINMAYNKNDNVGNKLHIFSDIWSEDEKDDFIVDQTNFYHIFYNEHNPLLGIHQYEITGSLMLNSDVQISQWDKEKRSHGGILQIYVPQTLTIAKHAEINAGYSGYFGVYGMSVGEKIGEFHGGAGYGTEGEGNSDGIGGGGTYGDKQLTKLYLGSGSSYNDYRGGGIIELIAATVINNGCLMCNGEYGCSGGSIKIRCKLFRNRGIIYAKSRGGSKKRNIGSGGSGRIAIFCEEFENEKENSIEPMAYVNNTTYVYDKDVRDFKFTEVDV